MFGTSDGSATINTRNIAVVLTDPASIAASGGTGADADGSRATAATRALQANGGPIETYNGIVSGLGVESQSAAARSQTQSDVAAAADDAVTSTSGVDTDEEMTNMLAYQRAYEAAARVMSVMDSTLDTLINNMGVG
jgi:flagellar hook-associated protein 1 FlgK